MRTLIPHVSIRPGYITTYCLPDGSRPRSQAQISNEVNLKAHTPNGNISRKAERRIKQSIDWLLWLSKSKWFYAPNSGKRYRFRINFVTLTLSSEQIHSDNTIKSELLNQFLVEARKRWKINNYLWRAESQKNGNIHFHLTCDNFIPMQELQDTWNRIQNKLGYVDRYNQKTGKINPPSTEVRSVKNIRNISAYLAKYCAKEETNRKIDGKLWGLSQGLSKVKAAIDTVGSIIDEEIRRIGDAFPDKVYVSDYMTCIYVPVQEWSKVVKGLLFDCFKEYVEQWRLSLNYKPPPLASAIV